MRVHENWMADNLCDFFSLFDAANLSYMPMPIRHVHVHIIFCCERMSRAYSTPSIRWQIRYVIARKRKNWEVRLTIHDVDSAKWKNIISTFSARRHRHSHGWTYRAHRERFFFHLLFLRIEIQTVTDAVEMIWHISKLILTLYRSVGILQWKIANPFGFAATN